MSLFPLAALVKEPRFIPPHRLAVRRRYKWPLSWNVRGWEGGGGEEEGRGYHRRRCHRGKENVCGPPEKEKEGRGAAVKIAREIPRRSDFFCHSPSLLARCEPPSRPFCSTPSLNTRVSAFYALNDDPLPLFPPRQPPALASR